MHCILQTSKQARSFSRIGLLALSVGLVEYPSHSHHTTYSHTQARRTGTGPAGSTTQHQHLPPTPFYFYLPGFTCLWLYGVISVSADVIVTCSCHLSHHFSVTESFEVELKLKVPVASVQIRIKIYSQAFRSIICLRTMNSLAHCPKHGSRETLVKLLDKNHVENNVVYNGYLSNHLPHVLCSMYSLGGRSQGTPGISNHSYNLKNSILKNHLTNNYNISIRTVPNYDDSVRFQLQPVKQRHITSAMRQDWSLFLNPSLQLMRKPGKLILATKSKLTS